MSFDARNITGQPVTIKDEGIKLAGNISSIDFTGTGVTGTAIGSAITEDIPGGGSAVESFIDLDDVPNSYTGEGGKLVRVKGDDSGLEFASATGGGDVFGPTGAVDSNFASYDGVTGKLIKDSGSNASSFEVAGAVGTHESTYDHTLIATALQVETDPIYSASSWFTTTNNAGNWDTAYGWGNHADAGYLTVETDPVFTAWLATVTPANWDTAYGWGDHAGLYDTTGTAQGIMDTHELAYDHSLIATALQSETDPLSVHLDQTIPQTFTAGDVSGTGLLNVTLGVLGLDTKTYIEAGDIDWATNVPLNETDPIFSASDVAGVTTADISNWDTAYGWGDHSTVGYLTSETDPLSLHLDQTTPQSVINGTPSFYDIKIPRMVCGTPTYSTQNDYNNSFGSTGRKTGGVMTDATGGYIAVTAGTGMLKATNDDNAQLMFCDFPAPANIQIPSSSTRYIGVEHNAGTPRVVARTSWNWDLDTEFPLGRVVNEPINGVDTLHIINNPWWVTDGITNVLERFRSFGRIRRDEYVGGLILAVTGTRNVAVTEGVLWSNLNEFPIPAIDTSVTGTIEGYWYKAGEGWQDSDLTQYSVTQWNDITKTTLQTIDNNKYCNVWIYAEADDLEIAIIYPQAQYNTALAAEAMQAPANLPQHILQNGILIGRIIIKQGQDTPVAVESAFDMTFTPTVATDHGNLTGLGDDDHVQYLLASGTRALSGNWDAGSFKITAETFASDVATGTAPFTIASATLNTNLNADLLDGEHASAFQDASSSLTSLAGLSYVSPSFVKMTGANTFTLDTNTYLTEETDPVYSASSWFTTTNNATDWNTAYSWGDHAGLYDLVGAGASAVAGHELAYDHTLIATALQSETDPLSLHLDQTTPQTVINGVPTINNGLLIGTNANFTDFPNAKTVISNGNSGYTSTEYKGLMVEAYLEGGSINTLNGITSYTYTKDTQPLPNGSTHGSPTAIKGIAVSYTDDGAITGVYGSANKTNTTNAVSLAYGGYFRADSDVAYLANHGVFCIAQGGDEATGVYAIADGGIANYGVFSSGTDYSFYGDEGKIYNEDQVLIGVDANLTDFPNAKMVVSQGDSGHTTNSDFAIVGEGTYGGILGIGITDSGVDCVGVNGNGKVYVSADTGTAYGGYFISNDTHAGGNNYGVYSTASGGALNTGIQGTALTSGNGEGRGVYGNAGVSNTGDTGTAYAGGFEAVSTHSGGDNVAVYLEATGSSTNNRAIKIGAGSINTVQATDWDLVDNSASALSFDTTGLAGILEIVTTNSGEGVNMSGRLKIGADASFTDFSRTKLVSSTGDTGDTNTAYIGVVGESVASNGVANAMGLRGVATTDGDKASFGVVGRGYVGATADTGIAYGGYFYATTTHAGANNIGVYANASGGALNYSFYGDAGKIYNKDQVLIGPDANLTDFANTKGIISLSDTGKSNSDRNALVLETTITGSTSANGIYVAVGVENAADTGVARAGQFLSNSTHNGNNYAIYADADNGALNYSFYGIHGKFYNAEGIRTQISNANVSNPPTDAQLDSAFGDPTTKGSGWMGVLDDAGAGTNVYFVYTTGNAGEWFYVEGVKAT